MKVGVVMCDAALQCYEKQRCALTCIICHVMRMQMQRGGQFNVV